jgi:NAD(P)-dependent dehydrogenase (short-subunit alcohol dehydrogenase family)
MTRQFIKPMLAQRRGSIINVSASGSLTNPAGDGRWRGNHPQMLNQPYDASKAALSSMSFYLAEEVKPQNVAVNVIFPGATLTTGSAALAVGRRAIGFEFTMLKPEHVVPLVLHLAGQDAGGETGLAYDVVRWNETHGHGAAAAWHA